MDFLLQANGVALPAPVSIESSNEIIWSANTGRSSNGSMVGTIVANKETFAIEWGVLTESEVKTIVEATSAKGFFSLTLRDSGQAVNMTVYRGSIQKQQLGYIGDGVFYYRSMSVSFIQK